MTTDPSSRRPAPTGADDVDLALVADDLAGVLDARGAARLRALRDADPAGAAAYTAHAAALSGLAALLGSEPAPELPDDVATRLEAALEREQDLRGGRGEVTGAGAVRAAGAVSGRAAVDGRAGVRPRRSPWRALAGWGAAVAGAAAVTGGLVLAVHGAGSSSVSSSAGEASAAVPLAASADTGGAAGTAAGTAGGASAGAASGLSLGARTSGDTPAAVASVPRDARAFLGRPTVTTTTLTAVVRALLRSSPAVVSLTAGSPGATRESPAPTPSVGATATGGSAGRLALGPTCRPAGVARSVRVRGARAVTYAGGPAVLVVLDVPGAGSDTVRAAVVRACGGRALLARTVHLAP